MRLNLQLVKQTQKPVHAADFNPQPLTEILNADFTRRNLGGRGSCRAKFSANREVGKSAGRGKDCAHREVRPPKLQRLSPVKGDATKFVINHWLKPVA